MTIQNYSGDYFIKMLKDLYDKTGVQAPQSDLDALQRLVDEERARYEKVKSWARVADAKIGEISLDLPIGKIYSEKLSEDKTEIVVPIPPNYSHLLMMGSFRSDRAASYNDSIIVQYNGDTGTNYRTQYVSGLDTTLAAGQSTGQTESGVSFAGAASATAGSVGNFVLFLVDYNSSLWKSTLRLSGIPFYDASDMLVINAVDFWESTDPIRSAKFFPQNGTNIKSGSILTIYGIK